jgi:type II secretory pathway pseudopilin PulG
MQGAERLMPVLTLLLVIIGLIAAVALFKLAGSTGDIAKANEEEAAAAERRACVEAAVARFPAVSVSAFVTRDRSQSGPLKLSYVRERQKAVAACE